MSLCRQHIRTLGEYSGSDEYFTGFAWAACLALIVIATRMSLDIRSWFGFILVGALAVVVAFAAGELSGFTCPRCHKRFFVAPLVWPVFLQRGCFHCGLPKYAGD